MKGAVMPGMLAVVAHPDDESFGLGAVIGWLRGRPVPVSALVFTHGEASTIGAGDASAELGDIRARELADASDVLGLTRYVLHPYPDGRLSRVPLVDRVRRIEEAGTVDALLAFDHTGITGHPDHIAATQAALEYATQGGVPLYLWTLPQDVAASLNTRFGTSFRGRPIDEITFTLDVGPHRERQWEAIRCHESQKGGLEVVRTRLELLGSWEHISALNLGDPKCSLFL